MMLIAAKLYGVQVEKFYVWYDSSFALLKFKIRNIEFGLGWLPIGGYVKIAGMLMEEGEEFKPFYFRAISSFKQVLIVIVGPIICLLLGVGFYTFNASEEFGEILLYTAGFLIIVFAILYLFTGVAKNSKQAEVYDPKASLNLTAAIIAWLFMAVLLAVSFYFIREFTPFFDQLKSLFNGDIELDFSNVSYDNWIGIISFAGVLLYVSNILPMGGLIGSVIVSSVYEGVAGKPIPEKLTLTYRLITLPIMLAFYGYFIYLLMV